MKPDEPGDIHSLSSDVRVCKHVLNQWHLTANEGPLLTLGENIWDVKSIYLNYRNIKYYIPVCLGSLETQAI